MNRRIVDHRRRWPHGRGDSKRLDQTPLSVGTITSVARAALLRTGGRLPLLTPHNRCRV